MRVLLLQERHPAAMQIRAAAGRLDCAIDEVATIADAYDALAVNRYDLIVTDLDALGAEASEFLQDTRAMRHLVLASRSELSRIGAALSQGADDFMTKPVDGDELRLRMGALATGGADRRLPVLECGPLRLEIATGEVSLAGEPLVLSPRERAVLQVLLRGRGSVMSKDHIASRVFGMDEDATVRSIETYVSRLRRKTAHPRVEIRTVHGLGYKLECR